MKNSILLFMFCLLVSCEDNQSNSPNSNQAAAYYGNVTFRGLNYNFSQSGISTGTGMLAADNNGGGWAATMQHVGTQCPNYVCNFFLGDGLVGSYPQQSIQFMSFPGSTVYKGTGQVTITHARVSQGDFYEGTFSGSVKNMDSLLIPGATQFPITGSFKLGTTW